jgi:phospholipid/cholesterol/gamma-HCH transport system substrate-binding protein
MRRPRGQRRLHPLSAAAIVIAATVAVTYYAFNEGLPFVHGFRIHAVVQAAQNLRGGSPVRIAGVDVGTVDGVSRGPNHTALVTMDLGNNALPLHTDATLGIRPRLFLEGSSYVELHPGSPTAPILSAGATVPLSRTTIAVQTYQVLSTFDRATRDDLKGLLHELSRALQNGGADGLRAADAQLAPALKDLSWVARAARGTEPGDLASFVRTASTVTATLDRNREQLADTFSSLDKVATALATTNGALAQSLAGTDAVVRHAPGDLAAVDHSLPPLTRLGRALHPALRQAPPLVRQVSSAVGQLATLVAPAERTKLLAALRGVFVALPSLIQRVGGLFPAVKPVTDCVSTHLAPILLAKVPDGKLSTGQPVWQEFAHALVGLSGASQTFDGNGYTLRILIGAGVETATAILPGLGKVIGVLPGSSGIIGARPQWVGDLTPDVFHPESPCSSQRLPNLASATAAPDFTTAGPVTRPSLTANELRHAMALLRGALHR